MVLKIKIVVTLAWGEQCLEGGTGVASGGAGNAPFLDLDAGCGCAHFGEFMSCRSITCILVS